MQYRIIWPITVHNKRESICPQPYHISSCLLMPLPYASLSSKASNVHLAICSSSIVQSTARWCPIVHLPVRLYLLVYILVYSLPTGPVPYHWADQSTGRASYQLTGLVVSSPGHLAVVPADDWAGTHTMHKDVVADALGIVVLKFQTTAITCIFFFFFYSHVTPYSPSGMVREFTLL